MRTVRSGLCGLALCIALALAAPGDAAAQGVPDALQGLDVLDLATAKRIALEGNPSLRAAAARVEQARARVARSRAAYFPSLDAAASGAHVDLADSALVLQPDLANPDDYYSAGLSANWLVFDGLARRFALLAARSAEAETRAAQLDAQRLLLSAVAAAYHGGQLARERVAVAQADLAFNARLLEEAQVRRRAGTGSLSDELNFEVRVNAARTSLIRAERDKELSRPALAALLGIEGAALPPGLALAELGAETPGDMDVPDLATELAYARERRPDVAQRRSALERARAGVGVARADFVPAVGLSASIDGERAGDIDFESEDFGTTVALTLSYNLFAGGARRAALDEAHAARDETERRLEDTLLSVASEVRDRLTALRAARDQLRLQRSNVSLVERARDLVDEEYRAGQTSLVRLNEAQRDLINAQRQLALARVSLRLARDDLDTATGRSLDARPGE